MLATDEALRPLDRAALLKEMTAAARRHTDPVEAVTAVRAIRRRELFRIAVADLLGLVDVDDRRLRADRRDGRDPRGGADRGQAGDRGGAARAAADPVAIVAMGRLRRLRAGLRQRRRRDVRARPAARRARRRTASRAARDVVNEFRRLLALPGHRPGALASTPTCAPRASRGRWCARWRPTPATTRPGRRSGRRRRCCGPSAMVGDEDLCRRFTELIDPLRFPADGHQPRTTSARYAGSRPGSTTSGCRAGPTRPPTSSSGAADWPTWSGPSSCSRCSTPAPSRGCAPPGPSTRSQAAVEADLLTASDADALADRVAHRQRAAQRDHPGARQARRLAAPRRPRAGRGRAHPWLRAGGVRPDDRRLPAGHPSRPSGRRAGVLGLTDGLLGRGAPRRPR